MTDAAQPDAAAQLDAARKALADAQAALAAAEAAATAQARGAAALSFNQQAAAPAPAPVPEAPAPAPTPVPERAERVEGPTPPPEAPAPVPDAPTPTGVPFDSPSARSGTEATAPPAPIEGPLSADLVAAIRAGYSFDGPAIELGALVNGEPVVDAPVRIPVGMLNRHGLVAGATGTGKTRTLQLMVEQLSAAGVPVFAADIKGDLSGIATPGTGSEKLLARTSSIGQDWTPASFPTEFYTLGGEGVGVPMRATVTSFGPLLLSKVLGLNQTQESSLGLVFHYADKAGLPLVDLFAFADQGADVFFGEPEIDTSLLLRTAPDGRGIVSLLEIAEVYDKPALFSTFLMWLLADLFNDLPEVGDLDKPKLVFFFDEAHLLFADASKDFIASIVATVRLIRSKGVGIVFVTQTPKDVPTDVLAQLGSRIQHQLRAHTPDDAKALKATVSTYPTSGYDLKEVLTTLATGEAIVTVMNEKGAPSPVAWTRLRAPQASMSPTDEALMRQQVAASPLSAQYGTATDRESAREILAAKMANAAAAEQKAAEEAEAAPATPKRTPAATRTTTRKQKSVVDEVLGSRTSQTVIREVLRGIFSTLKR